MNNKLTINNKPISVVRSGAKMLMPISDIAKFHIMIIWDTDNLSVSLQRIVWTVITMMRNEFMEQVS